MIIKELKKKDVQKVIQYAITGMHFEKYLKISTFLMHMEDIFGIWNTPMQPKSLLLMRKMNFWAF